MPRRRRQALGNRRQGHDNLGNEEKYEPLHRHPSGRRKKGPSILFSILDNVQPSASACNCAKSRKPAMKLDRRQGGQELERQQQAEQKALAERMAARDRENAQGCKRRNRR